MATHLCDADMAILIREARRWVVDAGFYTEADASLYGDGLLFLKVDRLYEGGWLAFERDNKALLSE